MNIELGTAFTGLGEKMNKAFYRYGFIIIFLIVASGIAVGLVLLNNIIAKTDDPNGYVSNTNTYKLDDATMQKIESLKDDTESTNTFDRQGVDRLLPF